MVLTTVTMLPKHYFQNLFVLYHSNFIPYDQHLPMNFVHKMSNEFPLIKLDDLSYCQDFKKKSICKYKAEIWQSKH